MTSKKVAVIMVDPPSGWKYGFPLPVPSGYFLAGFNLKAWFITNGYPEEDVDFAISNSRTYGTTLDYDTYHRFASKVNELGDNIEEEKKEKHNEN